MKKNIFGRKLKRDTNERKALFKSLMSSLVLRERIRTTEAKAKAIKPRIDKLITRAKKDGLSARSHLSFYLTQNAIEKLIKEIAPRFKNGKGGYSRIVRLGKRFSDNASMVLIEWTEQKEIKKIVPADKQEKLKIKKSEKEKKGKEKDPKKNLIKRKTKRTAARK